MIHDVKINKTVMIHMHYIRNTFIQGCFTYELMSIVCRAWFLDKGMMIINKNTIKNTRALSEQTRKKSKNMVEILRILLSLR